MIADLKPYAEYKESGLPWLGQVPGHWEVKKLREVARVINGFPFDSRRFSLSHGYPLIRIRDLDKSRTAANYSGKFVEAAKVLPGDLLIGMDGDFNVGTWRGAEPALLNQRMCRVEAKTPDATQFLRYVLPRTLLEINELTYATTVKHLSSGQVERIQFGSPPPAEQAAIVRFLDWANGRLERAIRAKRKVIALLGEQKQAIIHRAVTRGLDPSVPLKPSGIPWLGDIPQHWEVRKMRSLFQMQGSGTTPSGDRYYGGPIRWVMSGDLNDSVVRTTKRTVHAQALTAYSTLKLYPPKSLVVAMYGATIGKTGVLGEAACTNQACCVLAQAKNGVNVTLIQLVVQTAKPHLLREAYGGGQPNINADVVRSLRVPCPPIGEQNRILDHIEKATSQLDTAISRLLREIELLREYRTRLVADVVTGKLDVREAALHLPDEAPPDATEDDANLNPDAEAADEEAAV